MVPPEFEDERPERAAAESDVVDVEAPPADSPRRGGLHISPAWRRALLAMAAVLSLAMLGTSAYWAMRLGRAAWSPSSCSSCHAMKTEAANWAVGPHGKVACVQCHGKVDLVRFTFASVTGSYRQPVTAAGAVPSQVCLECHKQERQISPTNDLTIPHSFHISLNLDCVDCHAHLVHGPPGGNLGAAPADFGQRVPMERCRTCHNGSMAPKECTTCHADAAGRQPSGPKTGLSAAPATTPAAARP